MEVKVEKEIRKFVICPVERETKGGSVINQRINLKKCIECKNCKYATMKLDKIGVREIVECRGKNLCQ